MRDAQQTQSGQEARTPLTVPETAGVRFDAGRNHLVHPQGVHPQGRLPGTRRFPVITYDQLNENQRRAADWADGPVLVLAGAGSGKTAVLTLRVARLLEEDENASALALTVTDMAATEMRERVHQLLGERTDRAKLCTFHSFAIDILGQHGSHLGIRPDFLPLSQDEDRIALLDEVIHDLPDVGGHIPADRRNLLRLIDGVFGEGEAGDGASPSLALRHPWLPSLFRRYCDAMVHANRLDFGSLLFFAARLLREKPMVARVVRLGWTHICVDEFQDTNRAQYDLLRLLAPGRDHKLFVVADDDQIIYQWNGASPKRFQDLRGDYDVPIIALPENYRCPPGIVSLANRLIERNATRVTRKKTVAVREKRGRYAEVVRFRSFSYPEQEADFVAMDIRERELPAPECVVLARTNRLVKDAADTLRRAGHAAHVPVRKNEFDAPALSVLMEALRLASSPHDRVVLRRLCLAWGGLTGNDIDAQSVEAAAALDGGDFLRAWLDVAASGDNVGYEGACERIRADLVDGLRFPQVVVDFLNGDWRSWSGDEFAEETEEEVATWKGLHEDLVAEHGDSVPLHTYLQQLDLLSKSPPTPPNALLCMTVHGAKGLEFNHVYLIGLAQEVFPSYRALRKGEASAAVEEERRSCFVAITRAQETLTMTGARTYFGYPKRPSQFLAEMGVGP